MRLKPGRYRWNGHCGFTLAELLVVLAIAAILLSLAAPQLGELMRESRAETIVDAYVRALRVARSEAMTEHLPTAVCQSDQLVGCTNGSDWINGWLAFQDPNDNGACKNAADGICSDGGRVLLAHGPGGNGFTFKPNGNPRDNGDVSFGPAGFALGQASTFSLCDRRGVIPPRAVIVSRTGRVRTAIGADDANCP